jgi:ribokinase
MGIDMNKKKVFVIGTFIMDLVVKSSKMPDKGETVIGKGYQVFPGGKGINQAIAAARLGSEVYILGKVGNDNYGKEFLELLDDEDIYSEFVTISEKSKNGLGFINVDDTGENRIVVVLGANNDISTEELDEFFEGVCEGDIVITQMELQWPIVERIIEKAYEKKAKIVLNPAPAKRLSDSVLSKISYLIPNENEAEVLTRKKINSIEDARECGKILYSKGVDNVIITLGKNGSCLYNKEGFLHFPALNVKAIDTVGGGDAFNGGIAHMISQGYHINDAVRYANIVAALAVTKHGAIPSLPYKMEVKAHIGNYEKKEILGGKK